MKNNRLAAADRVAAIVAAAVLLLALGHYLGAGAAWKRAVEWIGSLGALAPIVFIMGYIAACVLLLPGSLLTIAGGALFGVVWGSIYVAIGATLGATAAFLVGRYVAREWVARKLAGNPRFKAIDAAVGREGWKIVGLTRLSPAFPFNLLNYAYGLTQVRLRDYVLATAVGILPATVMYVYIGSLAGNLAALGADAQPQPAARWILRIIGFAATVAVAVYVARVARDALAEQTRETNAPAPEQAPIVEAPRT
jgi:uncharacterized membrane protein YdjX (TVP38/TMEM64 family)